MHSIKLYLIIAIACVLVFSAYLVFKPFDDVDFHEIDENAIIQEYQQDNISIEYIGNKKTKKFHRPSCYTLPAEHNRIYFGSREEAINSDFVPCETCNP